MTNTETTETTRALRAMLTILEFYYRDGGNDQISEEDFFREMREILTEGNAPSVVGPKDLGSALHKFLGQFE